MTTIAIPSIHPLVRRVLSQDADVKRFTQGRVFAGRYPSIPTELPAVRFRLPAVTSVSAPAPRWWAYTGDVDCHADTEEQADGLVGAVLGALLQLEGTTHAEGVVQGVFNWSVQSVEDGEWSPPKPQRIVTVTLTARPV